MTSVTTLLALFVHFLGGDGPEVLLCNDLGRISWDLFIDICSCQNLFYSMLNEIDERFERQALSFSMELLLNKQYMLIKIIF